MFEEDELGKFVTSLFESALATGTKWNYGSNFASFYKFCDSFLVNPLAVSSVDIARYVAWLGQRRTMAGGSLKPYLSAINRLLMDHALPPVALGPLKT